MKKTVASKKQAKQLALGMAAFCVRNTCLEDLHAGATPRSETKDYSDVKIVCPDREIPWQELSRITDDEMKRLMKEVVDKIYSVLLRLDDPNFIEAFIQYGKLYAGNWDEPKDLKNLWKK